MGQIYLEYLNHQEIFQNTLKTIEKSYYDAISTALWELSDEHIEAIGQGILNSPLISGIRITSKKDVLLHLTQDPEDEDRNAFTRQYSFNVAPPKSRHEFKEQIIGTVTFQYPNSWVIEQTRRETIRILVAALIKSTILWFIILWTVKRLVIRPLDRLTAGFANVDLDKIHSENYTLGGAANSMNEFSQLESSFIKMILRLQKEHRSLLDTKSDLARLNQGLEAEVEVRGEQLKAEIAKSVASSKLASMGEMAGGIAHEINNPLAIILGRIRQLRKFITTSNEDNLKPAERYLDSMQESAGRVGEIVAYLRQITQKETNESLDQASISGILEQAIRHSESRFSGTNFKYDLSIREDLKVKAKPIEFTQILISLIQNAIEATKDQPEPWVEITVLERSEVVFIQIVDSGKGIPKSIRDKVFTPFFTTKDVGDGLGIGLSVAKSLLRSYGGELSFDFEAENTTVCIELHKV